MPRAQMIHSWIEVSITEKDNYCSKDFLFVSRDHQNWKPPVMQNAEEPSIDPSGVNVAANPKKPKHGVTFFIPDLLSIYLNNWLGLLDIVDIYDRLPKTMHKTLTTEAGKG